MWPPVIARLPSLITPRAYSCESRANKMMDDTRRSARVLALAVVSRIARYFLRVGLSCGDFEQVSRQAFCRAAELALREANVRPSNARIAVSTGLSRAEVAHTRRLKTIAESRTHYKHRAERVMHGWYSDADFTDRRGIPRPLARRGLRSLEELFQRYSGDIPPKALLDVLVEGAFARRLPNGMYEPLARQFACATAPPINVEDRAADIEIFFDTILGDCLTGRVCRIDATFAASNVPANVVRTCNDRADRFLGALSHYLHSSSLKMGSQQSSTNSTYSIVVLNAQRRQLDTTRDDSHAKP
jgi:Family of unknown function (DUF6502)